MKIFNLIFCVVFIFFAALQYNDPDPYIWIPIYMYSAILCWLAFRNKFYSKAYFIGIAVYLLYAIGLLIVISCSFNNAFSQATSAVGTNIPVGPGNFLGWAPLAGIAVDIRHDGPPVGHSFAREPLHWTTMPLKIFLINTFVFHSNFSYSCAVRTSVLTV